MFFMMKFLISSLENLTGLHVTILAKMSDPEWPHTKLGMTTTLSLFRGKLRRNPTIPEVREQQTIEAIV